MEWTCIHCIHGSGFQLRNSRATKFSNSTVIKFHPLRRRVWERFIMTPLPSMCKHLYRLYFLIAVQPGLARPILTSMLRPFHVCFPRRRWEDLLSLLEALPPLLVLNKGAVLLAELIDLGCWVDHMLSRAGHWDIEYKGIILDFLIFKKILTQISHTDSPTQQT